MNDKDETPLEYFERILVDPACIALGQTFISNVEYAIYLVKKHQLEQPLKLQSNEQ